MKIHVVKEVSVVGSQCSKCVNIRTLEIAPAWKCTKAAENTPFQPSLTPPNQEDLNGGAPKFQFQYMA